MFMYAISIVGVPGLAPSPPGPGPYYVKFYDPDAFDGRGDVETTPDIQQAMHFPTSLEAFMFWKQTSTVRPLREDGSPNRPLTAFTITTEVVPDEPKVPPHTGSTQAGAVMRNDEENGA